MSRSVLTFLVFSMASQICFAQASKPINTRAFSCDPIEFAELNSLGRDELEQFYCSASEGGDFGYRRAKAVPDSDNTGVIVASRQAIANGNRCLKIMQTAQDIRARKFAESKFSCEGYKVGR